MAGFFGVFKTLARLNQQEDYINALMATTTNLQSQLQCLENSVADIEKRFENLNTISNFITEKANEFQQTAASIEHCQKQLQAGFDASLDNSQKNAQKLVDTVTEMQKKVCERLANVTQEAHMQLNAVAKEVKRNDNAFKEIQTTLNGLYAKINELQR